MIHQDETRAYAEKRTRQGKSLREFRRFLKRDLVKDDLQSPQSGYPITASGLTTIEGPEVASETTVNLLMVLVAHYDSYARSNHCTHAESHGEQSTIRQNKHQASSIKHQDTEPLKARNGGVNYTSRHIWLNRWLLVFPEYLKRGIPISSTMI